jgi:regulatory protein
MPMITILHARQTKDSVVVELDNGESLHIPRQVAGPYLLETGRTIEGTEYDQLKKESQRYRCEKSALDYLAICPRSGAEMERYLGRKGFDHDLSAEIVDGLRAAGYIDDADYAARYISNKLGKKLVGKNLLASELQKKGISKSIIKHALKESELLHGNAEELYKTAIAKYASIKGKKNSLAKLSYFLRSRGFDHEMVTGVLERIRRGESEE